MFLKVWTSRWLMLLACWNVASTSFANAFDDGPRDLPYRSEKVSIRLEDGARFKAEVLVPTGGVANSTAPVPAVVFLNPFGQGYGMYLKVARSYAERGFLVLLFNPRGWHGSEGSTTFDYRISVADISQILDWLLGHYPVRAGGIGLTGISEGGGLSLLAAASDARIGAVAGLSAWSDLSHASLGNTGRTAWMGILGGLSLIFGDFVKMLREAQQEQSEDPTGERNRLRLQSISPLYQVEKLNDRLVPIYLGHNFDDILFPVNEMLDLYSALKGPKRLVVRSGFHAVTEVLDLSKDKFEVWSDVFNWFDQSLIYERIPAAQGISFSLKNDKGTIELHREDTARVQTIDYTASVDDAGQYCLEVGKNSNAENLHPIFLTAPLWHGGAVHTGIPLLSAFRVGTGGGPVRIDLSRLRNPSTLAFVSAVQKADRTIYGVPQLHVSFESKASQGQVIPHLIDVHPDGSGQLITHGVWSWFGSQGGVRFEQDIQLYGVAWKLQKGHKLMLAFDTRDLEYWPANFGSYTLDFAAGAAATTLSLPILEELPARGL